jgi:hypothetical protein
VVLASEGAAAVEQAVDCIETWPTVGALTSLFRQYGKE